MTPSKHALEWGIGSGSGPLAVRVTKSQAMPSSASFHYKELGLRYLILVFNRKSAFLDALTLVTSFAFF